MSHLNMIAIVTRHPNCARQHKSDDTRDVYIFNLINSDDSDVNQFSFIHCMSVAVRPESPTQLTFKEKGCVITKLTLISS